MKLAFIVQRYGREILGGSETLARQLAERLSRRHDITVLTTTAKDYITWKNEYRPGEEKLRAVKIIRFPVEGERDIEAFNKFSEEIYKGRPTREGELEWLHRQGPVVPELVEYLRNEHERFELLVFFTYLYYPTYYGLQVAPEKSILVPTAHDEPPLRLGIFKEMFQLPSSFIFNTEAEELLVLERFPVHKKMRETIGMGMDLLDQPDAAAFRKKHDIPGKYLLYAGRIDGGKGLEELFRYFTFFKEEHPASGNFQLILIGKLGMKLPKDPSIRYIGFVDEAFKLSAMAGALAVVQPSRMESLSIVTLEAFSVGTPVLVNAASRVMVDHCRRSNAGFYYADFEQFEEILKLMLSDRNLVRGLGRNGQRYIKENYGWSELLPRYELAFRASARPALTPKTARPRPQAPPPKREAPKEPAPKEPAPKAEVEERPEGEVLARKDEERPQEPQELEERVPEEKGTGPAARAEHEPAEGREGAEEDRTRTEEEEERRPPEEVGEQAGEEAREEPPSEDVAHLPSFYQSKLPPRTSDPEAVKAALSRSEPSEGPTEPAPGEGTTRPVELGEAPPEKPSDESRKDSQKKKEEEHEGTVSGEFELPAFYRGRASSESETDSGLTDEREPKQEETPNER